MREDIKGFEIIDPFAKEYTELIAARSDAYYKKLYEELFESVPTRVRAAIAKNYSNYLNKCTQPFFSLMSPFSWASPAEAMKANVEILINCLNLYKGASKYLQDSLVSAKLIRESHVKFKIGKNIALTPSEIVYDTPLLQLRRYIPRERTVYQAPLLMVYSTINGYFILDLTRELSLAGHFVDRSYDVFVTDWKLVTKKTKSATLEDYINQIVEAKRVIRGLTGEKEIGGLGYCIGGTLLDMEAALNGGYKYIINLTTLLNSKVGDEGAGLMGAFSDFSIHDIDKLVKDNGGVFPGEVLKSYFDWVKPEKAATAFMDLYFYGREYDYANDAIYFWNTFSARDVAGPAHRRFLWEIYYQNNLAKGLTKLFGRQVNLKNITVPFCNVAAIFDHIVPFPNALATAHLIGTPPAMQVTVKVEGGHVRGVVNPVLYPVLEDFARSNSGLRLRAVDDSPHPRLTGPSKHAQPGSPV